MVSLELVNAGRMTVRMDNGKYSNVILKGQKLACTDAEAARLMKDGLKNADGEFRCYWKHISEAAPAEADVAEAPKVTRKRRTKSEDA